MALASNGTDERNPTKPAAGKPRYVTETYPEPALALASTGTDERHSTKYTQRVYLAT